MNSAPKRRSLETNFLRLGLNSVRAIFLILVTAVALQAQTFTTLVNFGGSKGDEPLHTSLVQGIDGELYGTTCFGGVHNYGTVFKITRRGLLKTLYDFDETHGSHPSGGLVLASDGKFYGTTADGGADGWGTVYSISPEGELTSLHSFTFVDGQAPYGQLIQATNGDLYGTTAGGGASSSGTVFKMTLGGTLTSLYTFCAPGNCPSGSQPYAGLVEALDGNLYGTADTGGIVNNEECSGGCGVLYKVTPQGAYTTLYSFCSEGYYCTDGAVPLGPLVLGSDGNLYGTTAGGGVNNFGTVFKITTTGQLTTLYNFAAGGGEGPTGGLIQATDGAFYGTTANGGGSACTDGCGTIFQMTSTGSLNTLHNFDMNDGQNPQAALLQATSGVFYGTTPLGGAHGDNGGTLFAMSTHLDPFVAFVHPFGGIGKEIGILGQGFTGTTSVSLNATAASFRVVSDTFIEATVPAGATTGYVTVTTPGGTLTSNVPFRVLP